MGALDKIISKLRSSFPEKVDAAVLRKLAIAPNNESYIINTIRFLGVVDKESARTQSAHDLFVLGDDDFKTGFATMIKDAYKSLFDLHQDDAWALEKPKLVSFFRTEDKSTELVGNRQADTFIRLAELAGKRQSGVTTNGNAPKRDAVKRDSKPAAKAKTEKAGRAGSQNVEVEIPKAGDGDGAAVSLAVKIEVNLPATADQGVYDAIFKSIRANLINRD
jgi:hypothetical protein